MLQKDYTEAKDKVIELLSCWEGLVNTTQLIKHFSISRTHAQNCLKSYRSRCPENLQYNKHSKGFIPTSDFTPQHISTDVAEYLDWLDKSDSNGTKLPATQFTNSTLCLPIRQVSPAIMRGVISAIKFQSRIEVDYVSLANPNGEGRIIQPHTFVKTGLRWHLRAFDEKHREFRDFVLSRFRGKPEMLDQATHTKAQDEAWNTTIKLVFHPDSRLTTEQKSVIEKDYQMQSGQLITQTRAALAQYLLQDMQVNIKFLDVIPEAQQLTLVNLNDIKKWLFNA